MSKRAKYLGPHAAVDVQLPSGRFVTVERGHQLLEEYDGENVPAALRDELLSREDWSEVDQPTGNQATKAKGE